MGILGPFRKADSSKPKSSSKFPIVHLGAFSQSRQFKTHFLFEVPCWASWGLFSQSRQIEKTLPLRSSLSGILGPFRQADSSRHSSSSKFPIGHLGALTQSKQFKTHFLFEVLYWAFWGPFAKQTVQNPILLRSSLLYILGPFRKADSSKRTSSSKLPILEVPYWASWGLDAKQTIQNALPLRSSLLGILGPFRKADSSKPKSSSKFPIVHLGAFSQSRQFKTHFLFEVLYWAFWGPFAKQTVQNPILLRSSLLYILGPFRKADSSKRTSSSKFPIGHLWGLFSQSKQIEKTFPLRSSLSGILRPFRKADSSRHRSSSKCPIGISGPFRKVDYSERPAFSKFPIGHLGALFAKQAN